MTMIERIAQAMSAYYDEDMDIVGDDWRGCARAAIEAMREPSERMIAEGWGFSDLMIDHRTHEWREEMKIAYQSMIDAALADA